MPSHRLRPGEVAVELPATFDAGLYFVGRIHTPWARREDCPKNSGESKAVCTIEVDARYAEALRDIETVSHLIVLYFMDEAARDIVLQKPNHYKRPHGAFALRSPARPNPLAHSVVRLLRVEGTRLDVIGLDCRDGTPLVDIKPYFASIDAVPDAIVGWHAAEQA
ncbi:MAG TPA: tRNA (N6-threonylcarbamoyladenosine(37)-N6)-methyltransferase TrmO [Candidatus Angelobacter sp.]|nr:tRNA (N6-threonylcarbamoyladenosine(37)-N6)-methyltransferase TrmO [Candidatus Angelobacter sp.]